MFVDLTSSRCLYVFKCENECLRRVSLFTVLSGEDDKRASERLVSERVRFLPFVDVKQSSVLENEADTIKVDSRRGACSPEASCVVIGQRKFV